MARGGPLRYPGLLLFAALLSCGGDSNGPTARVQPREEDPGRPIPCVTGSDVCLERVELLGDAPGRYLPVYASRSLRGPGLGARRALVVIHGNQRNGNAYFETGIAASRAARELERTLVLAPVFQTADDAPASDEPYWSSAGWKRGHLSRPEGPLPRVSSYAALENALRAVFVPGRFPDISEVVVAGHSAGGQYVHRFAASSDIQEEIGSRAAFSYVVTNPSSYLYLREERQSADGTFAPPNGSGCEDYNEWHYGLRDLNRYAGRRGMDTLVARLQRRSVRILLGDADTLSASLDTSCAAMLQGSRRYERGLVLARFMDEFFPGHGHRKMVVPGAGHSSRDMWTSQVGLAALFLR